MPQRRLTYEILNPVREINNEEEIVDESNYQSFGKYPAAEFDDIGEFFIFLKEAGIEKRENHIISSTQEVNSIKVKSIYFLVTPKNQHLFTTENVVTGYKLITQYEMNQ